MISLKLIVFLAIGTALMWIPIVIISRWHKINVWKTIPIAILLTIAGTLGTYIWYFIENYGIGRSFYGAVFMVPVFFLVLAKILQVPYGELMDLCAPAECVMLAIMKIQCLIDGCCGGRVLFATTENDGITFPSQIVELINAFILCVILLLLSHNPKWRGKIYPMYMILYGVTRFVLNVFREEWVTTEMLIPYGNIWSVISVVIGIIWLIVLHNISKETAGLKEV